MNKWDDAFEAWDWSRKDFIRFEAGQIIAKFLQKKFAKRQVISTNNNQMNSALYKVYPQTLKDVEIKPYPYDPIYGYYYGDGVGEGYRDHYADQDQHEHDEEDDEDDRYTSYSYYDPNTDTYHHENGSVSYNDDDREYDDDDDDRYSRYSD
jgi:hypothetical protein